MEQPFQKAMDFSVTGKKTSAAMKVPSKRRAVIEFMMSSWTNLTMPLLSASIKTKVGDDEINYIFESPTKSSRFDKLIKLYADPGTKIEVSVSVMNPNVGNQATVILSGYFVDA